MKQRFTLLLGCLMFLSTLTPLQTFAAEPVHHTISESDVCDVLIDGGETAPGIISYSDLSAGIW